ncbi:MAG: hypothetical protein ACKUBY_00030 [Candidatus Moraniibacteriota bacterium]|jgi:hypothetical protein
MTGLVFGLVFGALSYFASRKIWPSIVLFGLNVFVIWVQLPVIAFGFVDLLWIAVLNGGLIAATSQVTEEGRQKTALGMGVGICTLSLIGGLIILPFVTSFAGFHSDEYRNLIGTIEQGVFSTDTAPVDTSHVRRVDHAMAVKLADKRLGEDMGLGSRVEIGKMSIQTVKGQLYWVGPLNHSKFFRWFSHKSGTPGYVIVSATNENDVKLVQKIDGKKLQLRYNKGAFWSDDPHRYIYNRGYSTIGLTDWTFEINDEGRPFYVVTTYEKAVGYCGNNATGIVLLDVQTGDIKSFSIENAPDWVDRIQPESFITSQLDDWGEYVHGWWNSLFANQDVLNATKGMSLVYGDDGHSYWYTGMQSDGADEGTVGFVLVNTRTKKAKMYRQAGATETAAKGSAEGEVQEKGYHATFPILYNIGGRPTYFMTLKDDAGLVKASAFVSVENYNIVGVAATAREAQRNYRRALLSKGNAIAPGVSITQYSITGKVLRIAQEPTKSGVTYYFFVEGQENKLFAASIGLSAEVVITQPNDNVKLSFDDGGNSVVDISSFDNLEIDLQKTDAQIGVEERVEEARSEASVKREGQNADAEWQDMTPEQKSEIMKKSKE